MTVSAPALAEAAALAAARALVPALAARAADHDAAGVFPAADFADLRTAGLLGLMQPATSDVCADWLGAAALGHDPEAGGRW